MSSHGGAGVVDRELETPDQSGDPIPDQSHTNDPENGALEQKCSCHAAEPGCEGRSEIESAFGRDKPVDRECDEQCCREHFQEPTFFDPGVGQRSQHEGETGRKSDHRGEDDQDEVAHLTRLPMTAAAIAAAVTLHSEGRTSTADTAAITAKPAVNH